MGINEIRALKAAKTGSVMTAAEAREFFKNTKVGGNTMEGKFHSGKYECSKGSVHFRSLWEANWALYLDWMIKQGKIKDWQYEPDRFFFDRQKLGTQSYCPDFKVFGNDGTIWYEEVKGFFDAISKTRLKRMKKYHPEVRVNLVEKKMYENTIRALDKVIKFYT